MLDLFEVIFGLAELGSESPKGCLVFVGIAVIVLAIYFIFF